MKHMSEPCIDFVGFALLALNVACGVIFIVILISSVYLVVKKCKNGRNYQVCGPEISKMTLLMPKNNYWSAAS